MNKELPSFLTKEFIDGIAKDDSTPFYVYSAEGIRNTVREFQKAFSWADYKLFYAVKALPNPHILSIIVNEGAGLDCSSLTELILSEKIGIAGQEIMFTSNGTSAEEFNKAANLDAIINLDDISHIDYMLDKAKFSTTMACRYNPGESVKGNDIIGNPKDAKFGMTREQIIAAFKRLKAEGMTNVGLHGMIKSNELDVNWFKENAEILFELALEIKDETAIEVPFVNLGGGVGVPYQPQEAALSIARYGELVQEALNSCKIDWNPKLYLECGRVITGPHGYLITKLRHKKTSYKDYLFVDATMADLMRPGMYGSHHEITCLPERDSSNRNTFDVVGSLCENNDKFAIDRNLPVPEIGDYLVIHDAGAHAHSMGFNYNGKLRPAEFLAESNGEAKKIRRAETTKDLFSTIVD